MSMEMTNGGKVALVRVLPTCGGTQNLPMLKAAELLYSSESEDFYEALGPLGVALRATSEQVQSPGQELRPLEEIIDTARKTTGKVDLESVIRHFSGTEHTLKFDNVPTIVARELPEELRAFAHTLLPLTMVDGRYYYDNGPANVEIKGLVTIGPCQGTPYAHLAGVVCFEDDGLSVNVLAEQLVSGLVTRVKNVTVLDYSQAPKLQQSTREAKQTLGM